MAAAQLAEVERQSAGAGEGLRHPRLIEQYSYRARAAARFSETAGGLIEQKNAHFTVVLAAVTAGRERSCYAFIAPDRSMTTSFMRWSRSWIWRK